MLIGIIDGQHDASRHMAAVIKQRSQKEGSGIQVDSAGTYTGEVLSVDLKFLHRCDWLAFYDSTIKNHVQIIMMLKNLTEKDIPAFRNNRVVNCDEFRQTETSALQVLVYEYLYRDRGVGTSWMQRWLTKESERIAFAVYDKVTREYITQK